MMKKLLLFVLVIQFYSTLTITQDFWEGIIVPDSLNYRCMDMGPNGEIFLGMWGFEYPGGIYRSIDDAQTWQYLGLDDKPVYELEVCNNGDIIAGVYSGIFKSNDNGNSWYEVYNSSGNVYTLLSLTNGYVFAGGSGNLHGIIRSKDYGETWDTVHVFTNYGQENLRALAISEEGHVYAGTYNMFGEGSIMFTSDLGETWEELPVPGFAPYWPWVWSLAFHPLGDLFAGFYGQGLYRYNFTTGDWTALYYPSVTPNSILFIGNDKIFIGLDEHPNYFNGIIYSEDGGQNFIPLNSGMNGGDGTSIGYLFYNPNKYIYALGWGFYRSIIPVLTTVENYLSPVLIKSMNIPNPFKLETLIKWENSNIEELVYIIVISSSGEIIFKDKISNTGSYLFHAGHILPGIYYYSVIAKNNVYSGKMVLIK